MPEIKRAFNLGKMNRDLDDRLVPAGQYRESLNINIGQSEGADVGAVENLLGNSKKSRKELKWKPKYSFDDLVTKMIDNDYKIAKNKYLSI